MDLNKYCTYSEIRQQPVVWRKQYENMLSQKDVISEFVNHYVSEGYEIYLTGAGTSAYIGDALSFAFYDGIFKNCRSVSTTDIVTNYKAFFTPGRKILLISFARSGNSPESVGAVNIANSVLGDSIAHIFITCNSDGELAKMAKGASNVLLVLLPPETNDKSLAMTSSFSTMAMSCLILSDINRADYMRKAVDTASAMTASAMERYMSVIQEVASRKFSRAVFLGSGMLKGIAEESHLKLQELTDGEVMCTFDSFLGFRHGPKAVVKEDTLMVYLISSDPYIRQYELDLIRQINENNKFVAQIAVSMDKVIIEGVSFDAEIIFGGEAEGIEPYAYVPFVFTAQLLGMFKSIDLGLSPDSPSKSGNIHRVVKGVTIYNI